MAKQTQVETYQFSPEFERAVTYLSCCRARFYGRVGAYLDDDAMPSAPAKLAIRAARAIAKDNGTGPDSSILVIQRLHRWRHEGQVTHEEILAVNDLFDAAEDSGLPDEEQVIKELAPMLRRRMESVAVKTAMDEYAKRGDFTKVVNIINKAAAIGASDTSLGDKLGGSSFDLIDQLRYIDRLPLGCTELDIALGGGQPRGQMSVFVGGPGGGKSMQLSQTGAYSMMNGLFVGYATFELPPPIILARLVSAITGITIDSIMEGNSDARQRIEATPLGPCVVKEFTANVSTVADVKGWVERLEQEFSRPLDLLVVDYADKIAVPNSGKDKDKSSYKAMEVVYEDLRIYGHVKKMWTMTASQSSRKDSKKTKQHLDLENMADSINKARVADLVVTLNASEENDEITYFIAKNRTGQSRKAIGPLPTDYACGLVCPIVRPSGPLGQQLFANNTAVLLGGREPGSD